MTIEEMKKNGTIDNYLELKEYINEFLRKKYPLSQKDLHSIVKNTPTENVLKREEVHKILNDILEEILTDVAIRNNHMINLANRGIIIPPYTIQDYKQDLFNQKQYLVRKLWEKLYPQFVEEESESKNFKEESFIQYVAEKNIGKEEIDLYDVDRNYVRTIHRGDEIKQDEWEQCILCFVVDKKGNFLVENKLNGEKDECSGHVKHDEVPTQAVIRELYEEYGIEIEEALGARHLDNIKVSFKETNGKLQCFLYIYVLFRTKEPPIKIDKREILNIEYIPYNDFFNMFENNKIFPYISQYKPIIPKLKELCEKIYEGKESNELERE